MFCKVELITIMSLLQLSIELWTKCVPKKTTTTNMKKLVLLPCALDILTFHSLPITFKVVSDYFVLLVVFEFPMEDNFMLTEWQSSILKRLTFHHELTDTCKKLPKINQLKLLVVVFARYHLMNICWHEDPIFRPEFLHLRNRLLEFIEKEVMINM